MAKGRSGAANILPLLLAPVACFIVLALLGVLGTFVTRGMYTREHKAHVILGTCTYDVTAFTGTSCDLRVKFTPADATTGIATSLELSYPAVSTSRASPLRVLQVCSGSNGACYYDSYVSPPTVYFDEPILSASGSMLFTVMTWGSIVACICYCIYAAVYCL